MRRRKLLTRVNESVEWTDEVISEFEAAEDEYEAETVGPIEEETADEEATEEVVETEQTKTEDTDDYDNMTVAELKDVLKEKGLPVSGKKSELIERLQGDSK